MTFVEDLEGLRVTRRSVKKVVRDGKPRYPIFTARRYASTVYAVVMCLCVCVSVTLGYCIKTAKRKIMQITPHDSQVF